MARNVRLGIAVGVVAVGVVAAVVSIGIAHERAAEDRTKCVSMLFRIYGAKEQWALLSHASSNAIPTWKDLYDFGGRGTESGHPYDPWYDHYPPSCPAGGTYSIGRVGVPPKCSILGHDLAAFGMRVVDKEGNPISAASIEMIGGGWQRFTTETGGDGWARNYRIHPDDDLTMLKWPYNPVRAIISKDGYMTSTDTIKMIWGTNYGTVCLRKE